MARKVKIIWVQPLASDKFGSEPKWNLAKSVFRKADAGAPSDNAEVCWSGRDFRFGGRRYGRHYVG